jgi:hypothetical protein
VDKYSVCQQVKVEYQKLEGLLQLFLIHKYKWEDIIMDFVLGLPREKMAIMLFGLLWTDWLSQHFFFL